MNTKAAEAAGAGPTEAQEGCRLGTHTSTNFFTGLLAGAAISSLVPWGSLDSVAPGLRIAAMAGLCASFVLFRLVMRNRVMRRAGGLIAVVAGSFLMSTGPYVGAGLIRTSFVAFGAGAFLCGITVLLREREQPATELRAEALERLLEQDDRKTPVQPEEPKPVVEATFDDSPDAQSEPEQQKREEAIGDDALSIMRALGIKSRFNPELVAEGAVLNGASSNGYRRNPQPQPEA